MLKLNDQDNEFGCGFAIWEIVALGKMSRKLRCLLFFFLHDGSALRAYPLHC